MKKNADRFLTATFCDDIRHETGNKLSLMGCYQGELFVTAMPSTLSKLCVYASAWTLKEKPFKALMFRIVLNDEIEVARVEIASKDLAGSGKIRDPGATRKKVSAAMMFSPFVIEKPGSLRVTAMSEDGELVGSRLLIKLGAPEAASAASQTKPKTGAVKRKFSKR